MANGMTYGGDRPADQLNLDSIHGWKDGVEWIDFKR